MNTTRVNGLLTQRVRVACSFVAVAVFATLPVEFLHAQEQFTGNWTIASWKVAPWVPRAERASIKPEDRVLNRTVTISTKGVAGPKVLACANARYEIVSAPFDMLFEGGLKQPKTDGAALGFKSPVKTLRPNCDFDFHMRDSSTVLFALDNVLYTMTRKAPTPR